MSCFHLRRWIVNKLEQTGTSRAPAAAACKRRSLDARILAVFFFLRFSRPPHSSPPVPEPEEAPVGCCQGGQTVPFEAPLFSCSLLLLAVPPLDLLAAQYLCNPTRGGREDRCASASPSAELAQGACLNDVTARGASREMVGTLPPPQQPLEHCECTTQLSRQHSPSHIIAYCQRELGTSP